MEGMGVGGVKSKRRNESPPLDWWDGLWMAAGGSWLVAIGGMVYLIARGYNSETVAPPVIFDYVISAACLLTLLAMWSAFLTSSTTAWAEREGRE
jgi:glucose dehydrogenase